MDLPDYPAHYTIYASFYDKNGNLYEAEWQFNSNAKRHIGQPLSEPADVFFYSAHFATRPILMPLSGYEDTNYVLEISFVIFPGIAIDDLIVYLEGIP